MWACGWGDWLLCPCASSAKIKNTFSTGTMESYAVFLMKYCSAFHRNLTLKVRFRPVLNVFFV